MTADDEVELESIRDITGGVRAILVRWRSGQRHALVSRRLLMDLIQQANPSVTVIEQETERAAAGDTPTEGSK